MQKKSYLKQVKKQYEHYPYPPRNPEEERRVLRSPVFSCLDAMNYYGWGGRRNFREHFRVLCAGGGTGDSTIFLAEQLRGTQAEVVHLDLSQTSIDIAKQRAAVRRLTNIRWVHASLLDVASLGLGAFDFINCTGVLHHLESPEAGLEALESVLAPGGLMGLMVYGKYGRTAIYQMQEMLRLAAGGEDDTTRLEVCKAMLASLPPSNWFHHSQSWFDDLRQNDAALYDLLLHSQDRAYSIPELYEFIEGAGLQIVSGFEFYDPATYIRDPALLERVRSLDIRKQYAIGELLAGNFKKHTFYAARDVMPPPSPDNPSLIPSLSVNIPPKTYQQLYDMAKASQGRMSFPFVLGKANVSVSPATVAILKYMDGERSLNDIYGQASASEDLSPEALRKAFAVLYRELCPGLIIFLRDTGVPRYLTSNELQTRFVKEEI